MAVMLQKECWTKKQNFKKKNDKFIKKQRTVSFIISNYSCSNYEFFVIWQQTHTQNNSRILCFEFELKINAFASSVLIGCRKKKIFGCEEVELRISLKNVPLAELTLKYEIW